MYKYLATAALVLALNVNPALAEDAKPKEFATVIKNHTFTPATIEVPAGEKFVLIVDNQDATSEEFESHALKREKIVKGNSKIIVNLGPLKAGEYGFVGEFHEDVAKGSIIAK